MVIFSGIMVYFMSNANEYKIKKQLFCIYDVYKYI
ncbi:hypothetical protein QGC_2546, partial [Clostridioides difficile CD196]